MNWDTAPQELDALRAQVAALTEKVKWEKMNTEVWMRDAEGKLKDRTAAYHELAAMTKELNATKEMRDSVVLDLSDVEDQLVAAQAHIAQLREALEAAFAVIDPGLYPDHDRIAAEALAIPADIAALDARLAQERERVILACEDAPYGRWTETIRSLK